MRKIAVALAALVFSSAACATPSGTLSLASTPNGGITLGAGSIDFILPAGPGGVGDFSTGAGTSISYSGGTLTGATNPYGQVKDIAFGSGTISNFIQFYAGTALPSPPGTGALQTFPVFDLLAVLPGGTAQGALNNCAGVTAVGVSCSPLVTVGSSTFVSPLVLTNRGAYMDVSFGVSIQGRDATGSTSGSGGFTSQFVSTTPSAFQSLLNSGGTGTSTYSATLALIGQSTPVPEPATWAMMLMGFCAIGGAMRYRRRNVNVATG
jgi:hypothetical protein